MYAACHTVLYTFLFSPKNKQTSKKKERLIWFRHAGYLSVLRGGTHLLVNLCNCSLTEWLAK